MGKEDFGGVQRTRGRPRHHAKGRVVERLLDATELLLQEHNHYELTDRMIAATAKVNEAMIHYYFGSKDGLLFSVIVRCEDEISEKLKALETIDHLSPTVTREIFSILIDAYYAKPWVWRMMSSEFVQTHSAIKLSFMKRYGPQGQGLLVRLRRVFERLIERGIYDPRVNAAYAALSMFSLEEKQLD
jgi:AcrR family transcriptional regulator